MATASASNSQTSTTTSSTTTIIKNSITGVRSLRDLPGDICIKIIESGLTIGDVFNLTMACKETNIFIKTANRVLKGQRRSKTPPFTYNPGNLALGLAMVTDTEMKFREGYTYCVIDINGPNGIYTGGRSRLYKQVEDFKILRQNHPEYKLRLYRYYSGCFAVCDCEQVYNKGNKAIIMFKPPCVRYTDVTEDLQAYSNISVLYDQSFASWIPKYDPDDYQDDLSNRSVVDFSGEIVGGKIIPTFCGGKRPDIKLQRRCAHYISCTVTPTSAGGESAQFYTEILGFK